MYAAVMKEALDAGRACARGDSSQVGSEAVEPTEGG